MTSTINLPGSRPMTPSGQAMGSGNAARNALPSYERIFHDELANIYATLVSLKNNRNNYINSKQVYEIYDRFLSLLHELKVSRKDEELKGLNLNLPNLNDAKIDDIWQLLSLCFVTCGLIKFAPATYLSLSTVSKLLGHLKECQVYTLDDLRPIKARLDEIRDIITNNTQDDDDDGNHNHKDEENLLLRSKLSKCEMLYKTLSDNFNNIPSDLEPTYHKLITIRKTILNYFTKDKSEVPAHDSDYITAKINYFKGELRAIESLRDDDDGKFHSLIGDADAIQAVLNGLIDDCNNLLNDLVIQNDTLSLALLSIEDDNDANPTVVATEKKFETFYVKLVELKQTLENLLVTRRWTLRETDLYNYQKLLKSIDDERIQLNKELVEHKISHTPKLRKNHIVILYLLRRCYSLIYKLLESSEPVSESLQPIHNQLSTVRRCLLEIKRIDGLSSLRDLYPFQLKLALLDNLRQDGKFIINGHIPEGQGTLNALLAECFDIIHELKIELEDSSDDESLNGGDFTNSKKISDDSGSKKFDLDEVEIKRKRYVGLNEADYDRELESAFEDELEDEEIEDEEDYSFSDSEYEGNDYY